MSRGAMRKVRIGQKLASTGSLEALKGLVAEFYVTTPERIRFSEGAGCWLVMVGEKPVATVVVEAGRRFIFGVGY